MKVKTYPPSIKGNELAYIKDNLFNKKGHLLGPAIYALPNRLKLEIAEATPNLIIDDSDRTESSILSERIYWIMHGWTNYFKKCKNCDNPITLFHSYSVAYKHDYCSSGCANKSLDVQETKRQVCQEKYGFDNTTQVPEIKAKIKKKLVARYAESYEEALNFLKKQGFIVLVKGETFSDKWTLKCECGKEFSLILPTWSRWNTDFTVICPDCSKGSSRPEKDIRKYVESIVPFLTIIQRDRKLLGDRKEIDFYIVELKLGVEYNGFYRHTDLTNDDQENPQVFDVDGPVNRSSKDKTYHLDKLNRALKAGIKLIQIYQDDWFNRQDQVKARLRSALGLNNKIYARDTQIIELNKTEAKDFFDENHLNMNVSGAIHFFGLTHKGKLVQAISIGKQRHYKRHPENAPAKFELYRSATIPDLTVVGGQSRLIKHALKCVDSFYTYVDRCWGEGESYEKAGGIRLENDEPSYFWCKGNKTVSRYVTQKYKNNPDNPLSRFLGEAYDHSISEDKNMRAQKWDKIWNTGNAVYLFK